MFYWITYFDLYGNPQAQHLSPLTTKKHPSRESVLFISSGPLSCFLFQEPDPLPGAGTGGPGGRRGRETDPGTGGETSGIEICAFPPLPSVSHWCNVVWILTGFNADPDQAFCHNVDPDLGIQPEFLKSFFDLKNYNLLIPRPP